MNHEWGQRRAPRFHTDLRTSDSSTLATSRPIGVLSRPPDRSAITWKTEPVATSARAGFHLSTHIVSVMRTPARPVPTSSIYFGSSYRVTCQWMTLRKPFTLINDDT